MDDAPDESSCPDHDDEHEHPAHPVAAHIPAPPRSEPAGLASADLLTPAFNAAASRAAVPPVKGELCPSGVSGRQLLLDLSVWRT
ncbi:hypothetical protein [Amycolatopsis plumensis]